MPSASIILYHKKHFSLPNISPTTLQRHLPTMLSLFLANEWPGQEPTSEFMHSPPHSTCTSCPTLCYSYTQRNATLMAVAVPRKLCSAFSPLLPVCFFQSSYSSPEQLALVPTLHTTLGIVARLRAPFFDNVTAPLLIAILFLYK